VGVDERIMNPRFEKARVRQRESRRWLRDAIFKKLGDKCIKCGFSDRRALQVDHVNGDGTAHRKQCGGSTFKYLRSILRDITGAFQLLCANCHMIKHYKDSVKL
jgi:hypothetical protein